MHARNRGMRRSWVIALAAALVAVSCSLNPQTLPPHGFGSSDNGGTSGADGSAAPGSSGGGSSGLVLGGSASSSGGAYGGGDAGYIFADASTDGESPVIGDASNGGEAGVDSGDAEDDGGSGQGDADAAEDHWVEEAASDGGGD
jgi:hypothetical protein